MAVEFNLLLAKIEVSSPDSLRVGASRARGASRGAQLQEVLRDPIEEESNVVRFNEHQWQAGDRQC